MLIRLLGWVPYLYLLRFPLLLAATLLLLVPLALWWAPSTFRNLLVLTPGGMFVVALLAALGAFTVMVTRRIVLLHGPARFDTELRRVAPELTAGALGVHLLVAAPLLVTILVESYRERTTAMAPAVLAMALGVAGATLMMAAAEWIRLYFTPPPAAAAPEPDLLFPTRAPLVAQAFAPARRAEPAADLLLRPPTPPPEPTWPILKGYVDPGTGRLLSGHMLGLLALAIFLLVYAGARFWGWPEARGGTRIPALAFLLIIVTTATWGLAGVAFFLDRYRIPTLAPVLVWLAIGWMFPSSDHVFVTEPPLTARPVLAPAALVQKSPHPVITVVAASGGGIRAAGWAARVLTGIQEAAPEFIQSLRFVSAVSGGSVGTMFFLERCARGAGRCPPGALADVLDRSMRSSLNEIGWGFAYPDLSRALLPFGGRLERDRAWALERAWARHLAAPEALLSTWRSRALRGEVPAVAFNATIVETGQRLVITTGDLPEALTFDGLYERRDVRVVTAVRLSATFPFVTPVARAEPRDGGDAPLFHLADGGYVDNGGIGTAVEWVAAALDSGPPRPVALVDIDAVVSEKQGKDRGWPYQLVAPLTTLLAIRTQAPRERNEFALRLLTSQRRAPLQRFCFRYEADENPLSWHLSPEQQRKIRDAWLAPRNQAELARLRQFLAGAPGEPADRRCPS